MESNNELYGESKMYNVELNGVRFKARRDDRIENYLYMAPHKGTLPPLGVIVNNRLAGLNRRIFGDCTARTVDYSTKEGAFIYRRTACHILYAAVRRMDPKAEVIISQSIRGGYFFELKEREVSAKFVSELESNMKKIVDDNIRIEFKRVLLDEAKETLSAQGHYEKVRWVAQIPRGDLWMAELLGFYDLLRGPLATSTGPIKNYALEHYQHGFVLRFPKIDGSRANVPKSDTFKLFSAFQQTRREHEILGVSDVAALIDVCVKGRIGDLVEASEALFKKRIMEITDDIQKRRKDVRLILIAGPSSSGKTTFTKRLATFLRISGIKPETLSMDNYYVDRERTPRNPDGSYDFENIEALDIPLFNDHMEALIAGREVKSPVFDFIEGRRSPTKNIPLSLDPGEVLVMEGIHALNPRLHRKIPEAKKYRIFVSALTQLNIDRHNRIFTSDTRLIRRIVRDRLFRGYSAADTINNWASVRAGESKYIFPFQESADMMFNSALIYEHAVLCTYAKRFLLEVPYEDPAYVEANRLFEFADLFLPVFLEEVPRDSVLREFIGGTL